MSTVSTPEASAETSGGKNDGPPKRSTSGRGRGVVAWVLLVIAAILLPLGVVGFWGQRSLTDTERYVATVAPLSQDQAIREQIATAATDALQKQVDSNQTIDNLLSSLPEPAQKLLKAPIEGAINSLISQVVHKLINSEQFDNLWIAANKNLQQQLISALQGDQSGAVKIQNDEVVLDIGTVIEKAKEELVAKGVTALADKPVPEAADREIVLLKSDQVKQARIIYAFSVPIARWLLPLAIVLFLASVLISTRRARMVLASGVAIAIGMTALSIGLTVAREQVSNSFASTPYESVVNTFFVTLTRYLSTAVSAAITIGVVVAVLGWFGGRSHPATSLRGLIGGGLRQAGARVNGTALAGVGKALRDHPTAVKIVIGVLATAVLLVIAEPITVASVLWVTAIALALAALAEFLSGIASPATPEDPGEESDRVPTAVIPTS